MQIEPQDDKILAARVFPNSPAEAGGVQPGDHIMAVDSVSVVGLRLDQVSGKLIGQPGTKVDVVFQRAGVAQPIRGRFTRAVIRVPAVPYSLVLDGGVGYIPRQSLNDSAAQDVAKALHDLSPREVRRLV